MEDSISKTLSIVKDVKSLAVGEAGLPQIATELATNGYVRNGWRMGKLNKMRNEEQMVKLMQEQALVLEDAIQEQSLTILSGVVDGLVATSAPRVVRMLRQGALQGKGGTYLFFLLSAFSMHYADEGSFEDLMALLACCLPDTAAQYERTLAVAAGEVHEWAQRLAAAHDYQAEWGAGLVGDGKAWAVSVLDIPILALSKMEYCYVPQNSEAAACLRQLARLNILPGRQRVPGRPGFYVPSSLTGGDVRLTNLPFGAVTSIMTWGTARQRLSESNSGTKWIDDIEQADFDSTQHSSKRDTVLKLAELLGLSDERRAWVIWAIAKEDDCKCSSCAEVCCSLAKLPFEQLTMVVGINCNAWTRLRQVVVVDLSRWAVVEQVWFGANFGMELLSAVGQVRDRLEPSSAYYERIKTSGHQVVGQFGSGLTHISDPSFGLAYVGRATGCFFVNGENTLVNGRWYGQFIVSSGGPVGAAGDVSMGSADAYDVLEEDRTGSVGLTAEIRHTDMWCVLDLHFTGSEGQARVLTLHARDYHTSNKECAGSCGKLHRAVVSDSWADMEYRYRGATHVVLAHENPSARLLAALSAEGTVFMQTSACMRCSYEEATAQGVMWLIDGVADAYKHLRDPARFQIKPDFSAVTQAE